MTIIARHAPADSYHLVLTYSHRLDEAIIHAILMENQFTRLGLIGSVTKRQRFFITETGRNTGGTFRAGGLSGGASGD